MSPKDRRAAEQWERICVVLFIVVIVAISAGCFGE